MECISWYLYEDKERIFVVLSFQEKQFLLDFLLRPAVLGQRVGMNGRSDS
jgi:predicted PurR-regulated permease PerM